jgi:hypothetical protein
MSFLYTQAFRKDVEDLALQSEYMEEGDLLICSFAFLSVQANVESVIRKFKCRTRKHGVVPHPDGQGELYP